MPLRTSRWSPIALALPVLVAASACGGDDAAETSTGSTTGATGQGGGTSTTTGPGGAGGGGGAASACGDGVVDPGEECDDAGESIGCDADCTAATCGDGTHNKAAGEGCDDGNASEVDACSAGCMPTAFTLQPTVSTNESADAPSVVATPSRFLIGWTANGAGGRTVRLGAFAFDGTASGPLADVATGQVYAARLGVNDAGRVIVPWTAPDGMHLRYAAADGAFEAGETTQDVGDFFPVSAPASTADGRFCMMASTGDVRCTDANDGLGPAFTVAAPDPSSTYHVDSAHLLRVGSSMIASYVVEGAVTNYEFRARALAATGQPQGDEGVLAQIFYGAASGGIAHADGSFGLALHPQGESLAWFPFDASGVLDVGAAGPVGVAPMGHAGRLLAHSSGRSFFVWTETMSMLQNGTIVDTCSVWGQRLSAAAQPDGPSFVVYAAPTGQCASRFGAALNGAGDLMVAWAAYSGGGGSASYHYGAIVWPRVLD